MWPDTVNDTGWRYDTARGFYVSFSSSIADTSYAKLVIYDNNHSDTISLVGYGMDDRIDYTLRWLNGTWDTTGGGSIVRYYYVQSGFGNQRIARWNDL